VSPDPLLDPVVQITLAPPPGLAAGRDAPALRRPRHALARQDGPGDAELWVFCGDLGLRGILDCEGTESAIALPLFGLDEVAVYYVVSEALANAAKHSPASEVSAGSRWTARPAGAPRSRPLDAQTPDERPNL
jgi:hypothetical protein